MLAVALYLRSPTNSRDETFLNNVRPWLGGARGGVMRRRQLSLAYGPSAPGVPGVELMATNGQFSRIKSIFSGAGCNRFQRQLSILALYCP